MKIRQLQLKNIGVFDDETIKFQSCPAKDKAEIHIFTGQNGSGKTTILQALTKIFSFTTDLPNENSNITSNISQVWNVKGEPIDVYGRKITETKDSFHKYLHSRNSHFLLDLEHDNKIESDIKVSRIESNLLSLKNETIKNDRFEAVFKSEDSQILRSLRMQQNPDARFEFASFAYAGYRRIKAEKINLFEEVSEDPLYQALEFNKDENSKFTINQWLGRNLSKRALAIENNDRDANKFAENIKNLEEVIAEIVGYRIRFKLNTDLSLCLIKDNQELDFDVLPDGLKSLISWIGDLLMRLDSLKWKNDAPIFEREILLFLDEIEIHLHPAWQRKVLPVVQKLFKKSQIFVSTHSPFVVNSIDDAWIYKLELQTGRAKIGSVERSEDGYSYSYVLEETFDIKEEFGIGVQKDLERFKEIRNQILASRNGSANLQKNIQKIGKKLAKQSEELNTIVQFELRQINRRKGTMLAI